jgi:regulator of RNase E activity RraA
VLHGSARDIAEVRAAGYPLFSTGVTMVSGKNRFELSGVGAVVDVHGTQVRPGDVILADDSGALVVPAERAVEVVERAERVEATEHQIAAAVAGGSRLDEARAQFGYATPWQEKAGA